MLFKFTCCNSNTYQFHHSINKQLHEAHLLIRTANCVSKLLLLLSAYLFRIISDVKALSDMDSLGINARINRTNKRLIISIKNQGCFLSGWLARPFVCNPYIDEVRIRFLQPPNRKSQHSTLEKRKLFSGSPFIPGVTLGFCEFLTANFFVVPSFPFKPPRYSALINPTSHPWLDGS